MWQHEMAELKELNFCFFIFEIFVLSCLLRIYRLKKNVTGLETQTVLNASLSESERLQIYSWNEYL